MNQILNSIRGQLIVSCQALENEPLHGADIMAKMAMAAEMGGACGIRANGVEDIKAIKAITKLPIIGIIKREYPNSEIYITPTNKEVDEICTQNVEIIAVDLTNRVRPDGKSNEDFIRNIRLKYPEVLIMADISTYEEGMEASRLGVDMISTTLSGYTTYSNQLPHPDYELIERLVNATSIPIIAEGKVNNPEEAVKCLEIGAWSVVVGSAITRPQLITKSFSERIKLYAGIDITE
ncbi:N-acetylmannosamine-6-phosphate 2-epimerase [Bacillus massilinigeriensis]|uniref:N-acetylmannosamine-6-phosphate 2-epimerase n=1 Tax=Bacillus massilionigeriensis TaxID=1805475 RepID=UPI000AA6DC68|nr:N-acetylmannosamine-6-phosphate 2-epimerase [Bacillus massilionigeriensis]